MAQIEDAIDALEDLKQPDVNAALQRIITGLKTADGESWAVGHVLWRVCVAMGLLPLEAVEWPDKVVVCQCGKQLDDLQAHVKTLVAQVERHTGMFALALPALAYYADPETWVIDHPAKHEYGADVCTCMSRAFLQDEGERAKHALDEIAKLVPDEIDKLVPNG